jgi:hypothetical protein
VTEYVSLDAVQDLKVKYLVPGLRPDGQVDSLNFERELNALPRLSVSGPSAPDPDHVHDFQQTTATIARCRCGEWKFTV